jgi:hypothetical protein
MFAGLNLAIFSLSRLRLEIAAKAGDPDAVRVRELADRAARDDRAAGRDDHARTRESTAS